MTTIRDFAASLADVPPEILLDALELSNRRKGTIMAARKLSAAQGITKAKPHIKKFKDGDDDARADLEAIRAQIKPEDLNAFDDKLDELVNPKP
jgi:hypothetical protein